MGMLNFDARQIAPQVTLEPVPDGWYKVIIRRSNMKPTAKGDGSSLLELQCEVIEGQYVGRVVYWNLNLFNMSTQASEIAGKQLSAICHVLGVYNVNDQPVQDNATPMLHNLPFYILVVISHGEKGPINNVKGCKDINGNDPGKQGQIAPQQQQPQPQQPAQGTWQAPGAQPMGGMAPGGWTPPASTAAAPMAQPAGWTPGQNQQPQPQQWSTPGGPAQQAQPQQWQQPGQPQGGQPQGQPMQQPQAPGTQPWTANPAQPAQPQQQQPAQQWNTGQPTQPAQPMAPPNQGWTQGGTPSNAPWQRGG